MRKADNLPPYCAVVKKSGSLNFLEPSRPAWPVTGVLYLYINIFCQYALAGLLHVYRQSVNVLLWDTQSVLKLVLLVTELCALLG